MTQAVQQVSNDSPISTFPELAVIDSKSSEEVGIASSSDLIPACIFLGILQLLDGFLTAVGVANFGIQAEGNLVLRTAMENFGALTTIVLAKTAALGIIFALYQIAVEVRWIPHALKFLIGLYLFAAIVPWSMIMITKLI